MKPLYCSSLHPKGCGPHLAWQVIIPEHAWITPLIQCSFQPLMLIDPTLFSCITEFFVEKKIGRKILRGLWSTDLSAHSKRQMFDTSLKTARRVPRWPRRGWRYVRIPDAWDWRGLASSPFQSLAIWERKAKGFERISDGIEIHSIKVYHAVPRRRLSVGLATSWNFLGQTKRPEIKPEFYQLQFQS